MHAADAGGVLVRDELQCRGRWSPVKPRQQQTWEQHQQHRLQQGVAPCGKHKHKSNVVVPCEECDVGRAGSAGEGSVGRLSDGRAAAERKGVCVACNSGSSGFSAADARTPILWWWVFLQSCV